MEADELQPGIGIEFTSAIEHLDYEWNVAADNTGAGPDVQIEDMWRDIRMPVLGLGLSIGRADGLHVLVDGKYGKVISGTYQESIYGASGRQNEVQRTMAEVEGYSTGYSFRLAYALTLARGFRLIPQLGFSERRFTFWLRDAQVTVPSVIAVSELESRYEARWQGPSAGLAVNWRVSPYLSLHARSTGHLSEYRAWSDLNLRADLQHPRSLRQTADAIGLESAVAMRWHLPHDSLLGITFAYDYWLAEDGLDERFPTSGPTQQRYLNEASWRAWRLGFSLGKEF